MYTCNLSSLTFWTVVVEFGIRIDSHRTKCWLTLWIVLFWIHSQTIRLYFCSISNVYPPTTIIWFVITILSFVSSFPHVLDMSGLIYACARVPNVFLVDFDRHQNFLSTDYYVESCSKLSRSFDFSCLTISEIYVWETETEVFQVIHLLTFPKWHFSLTFYSSYFDFYKYQTLWLHRDQLCIDIFLPGVLFANVFIVRMFFFLFSNVWVFVSTKVARAKSRKLYEKNGYIRKLILK